MYKLTQGTKFVWWHKNLQTGCDLSLFSAAAKSINLLLLGASFPLKCGHLILQWVRCYYGNLLQGQWSDLLYILTWLVEQTGREKWGFDSFWKVCQTLSDIGAVANPVSDLVLGYIHYTNNYWCYSLFSVASLELCCWVS